MAEDPERRGDGGVLAHLECGSAVETYGGDWSLVCWCARGEDLRTYRLVEEDKLEQLGDVWQHQRSRILP